MRRVEFDLDADLEYRPHHKKEKKRTKKKKEEKSPTHDYDFARWSMCL